VTFDGERGRWLARIGDAVAVTMTIAATGPAQPTEAPLCSGDFVAVPVRLTGIFELRTGTKLFRTVRLRALSGVVRFSPSGAVDCLAAATAACDAASVLTVVHRDASADFTTLLMSPTGRWTTLSFAERRDTAVTWYHVMELVGVDPVAGQLPTLSATLGPPLPIRGSGRFMASQTSRVAGGPCSIVSTSGSFAGTFRATFAGWGSRSVTFGGDDFARYTEQR
jgi:hypothetical protein